MVSAFGLQLSYRRTLKRSCWDPTGFRITSAYRISVTAGSSSTVEPLWHWRVKAACVVAVSSCKKMQCCHRDSRWILREGIRQVRATLLGARHVPDRLCNVMANFKPIKAAAASRGFLAAAWLSCFP